MILGVSDDARVVTRVDALAFVVHDCVEGIFRRRSINCLLAIVGFREEGEEIKFVGEGDER